MILNAIGLVFTSCMASKVIKAVKCKNYKVVTLVVLINFTLLFSFGVNFFNFVDNSYKLNHHPQDTEDLELYGFNWGILLALLSLSG